MRETITIVSVGGHTRLGDVLEGAVDGLPFETADAAALSGADWSNKRLLFAVSADAFGANEALGALSARVLRDECDFSGSVCTAVLDAAQGGNAHADLLKLLLAVNGAGCTLMNRPCVEAGRDMKSVPLMYGGGRGAPFVLYARAVRALTERLAGFAPAEKGKRRVRFVSALESEGTSREWRTALERMLKQNGGAFAKDDEEADTTLLLAENTANLPDETTLRALDDPRGGALRCILASPWFGAELFCMLTLERACLQGSFYLPPNAFTVLEGVGAGEALATAETFERAKRAAGAAFDG